MAPLILLLPRLDRLVPKGSGLRVPHLERLHACGRDQGAGSGLDAFFDVHPKPLPVAAITRGVDGPFDTTLKWLRADPAHVRADRGAARLLAVGELGLDMDDTAQLTAELRKLFGDDGFVFEAPHPERWYVGVPREARLPTFTDPDTAFGADILAHLPRGDGEARWRRLLNEAQVLLHQHPLNAERAARGRLPVNSLWLWGAGPVPDWVRTPIATLVSDDPLLLGLAKLANVAVAPADPVVLTEWSRPVLIDLRRRRDAAALDAEWMAPAFEALRRRRFESITLAFEGAAQRLCRRPNLWQRLRRPKGLW